jgi:hypothetical protein
MAWVTWRQHRIALAGAVIGLGAFAVVLGVTGLRMQSAYSALAHAGCSADSGNFNSRCGQLWGSYYHAGYPFTGNISWVAVALAALPALIGMFSGAPLVAREFESGTVTFAWTQVVSRGRWMAAKLGLLGAALAAAGVAFGLLASWWLLLADGTVSNSRWQPQQFGLTAVTFPGWVVLLFAAGVLAGTMIRRTVPAMAATGVFGTALLWFTIEQFPRWLTGYGLLHARASLVPATFAAEVSPNAILVGGNAASGPAGGWVVKTWFTRPHGQIVSPDSNTLNPLWNLKPSAQPAWLASHHLTLWVGYQSASRFWIFQAAECAVAVALAVVLGAAAVWLVRRRSA